MNWLTHMDSLTIFGLITVGAMLMCDTFERKSYWWTLGFAGACFSGSAYGFMQGATPFGILEGVWGIMKLFQFKARFKHESGHWYW